jgi:hypothetical protein
MNLLTVIFFIHLWILSTVGIITISQNVTLVKTAIAMAAVGGNNKALFGGGDLDGTSSSVVDIFDATLQRTTASLSQDRYGLAAASVDDLVLFGGGYSYTTKSTTSRGTI